MALTREEALAAAERADVFPPHWGAAYWAYPDGREAAPCGCPATAVGELRRVDPSKAYRDVAAVVCPDDSNSWNAMIRLLGTDPPEVAKRLRAYAASLPEDAS